MGYWSDVHFVRQPRRERDVRNEVARRRDDPLPARDLLRDDVTDQAPPGILCGVRGRLLVLSLGARRHERQRVDSTVRVRERHPDLSPAVLEDEHVRDVLPGGQLAVAVGPDLHEVPRLCRRQRSEGGVVLRRVHEHLSRSARGGRPKQHRIEGSGSAPSARRLGKRFSKATISYRVDGISVEQEAEGSVGQSGHASAAGRNVRSWRPVQTITCSPSSAFQRSSSASSERSSCARSSTSGSGCSNA